MKCEIITTTHASCMFDKDPEPHELAAALDALIAKMTLGELTRFFEKTQRRSFIREAVLDADLVTAERYITPERHKMKETGE